MLGLAKNILIGTVFVAILFAMMAGAAALIIALPSIVSFGGKWFATGCVILACGAALGAVVSAIDAAHQHGWI